MDLSLIGTLIFIGFGVPISIIDARTRNIPNWLTLSFLVTATASVLISALFFDADPAGALLSSIACLLVFVLLYFLARGGFGEADVKLAPGFGMLLGASSFSAVTLWLLGTFIFAGIFAAVMLLTKKLNKKDEFAFAPFMFLSALSISLAS
ncbi:MAG: A24 family peptidase [Aquiluna sp.]|nr:A24 family peptidase [Aquiluna sp.]MCF8546210.1 A24 family peptidase [Aquiluna sp.]